MLLTKYQYRQVKIHFKGKLKKFVYAVAGPLQVGTISVIHAKLTPCERMCYFTIFTFLIEHCFEHLSKVFFSVFF